MNEYSKFCPYCGKQVSADSVFCSNCGASLAKPEEQDERAKYEQAQYEQYQQGQYSENVNDAQTQYGYDQVQYTQNTYVHQPVSKKNSILSMIFSLVSLTSAVYAIIPPFLFIAFTPIAIVFMILGFKKRNTFVRENGMDNGFSKTGKICSTISIPVTIIFTLLGLILSIAFVIGVAAAGAESYYYYSYY